MAPDAFTPVPNAWGRQGWTTAMLAALSDTELEAALRIAWSNATHKKPKRGAT